MTTPTRAYEPTCVNCGQPIERKGRHVPEPAPAYPALLSPADHYAEADRLLRLAESEPSANWQSDVLAAAQVHATLALSPWGYYQQGASS